ncbi:MAG: hypothetical protein AAF388_01940 [Bacteroidota bacterium]
MKQQSQEKSNPKSLEKMTPAEQAEHYRSLYHAQIEQTQRIDQVLERVILSTHKLYQTIEPLLPELPEPKEGEKEQEMKINPMALIPVIGKFMKSGSLKTMQEIVTKELLPVVQVYLPYYQKKKDARDGGSSSNRPTE